MSTYNENLQVTTTDVLSQMQDEKKKLESINQAAEYTLYYAQGANIVANVKMDEVQTEYDFANSLDVEGVQNDNIATNVLDAATQANTDVGASVSNTAVAASNVQIAANAVTELAADMASALSYVGSETHTPELYSLAETADKQIQDTAYMIERVSQLAMDASAATSEIQASQLLAETTAAKAGIESLLKATEGEYSKLATKLTADTKTVNTTSTAEIKAEGELEDSIHQLNALEHALNITKRQLNFDLEAWAVDNMKVSFSCIGFRQPFPHVSGKRHNSGSKAGTLLNPPEAEPKYFGVLVPEGDAELFSLAKAEMLFERWDHNSETGPFFKLHKPPKAPSKPGDHIEPVVNKIDVEDLVDVNEEPILKGKSYVLCLYIHLSQKYKNYLNDNHDVLSAPTEPFTLSTNLPHARHIKSPDAAPVKGKRTQQDQKDELKGKLQFVVKEGGPPNGVQYRCILLPLSPKTSHRFLTENVHDKNDKSTPSRLKYFFNFDIASKVSPGNCTIATLAGGAEISDQGVVYWVGFDDATTDNFGDPIQPKTKYLMVVLSELIDEANTSFTNTMSNIDDSPIIEFREDYSIKL